MAPDELLAPDETETPRVRLGSGSALSLATQVIGLGASFLVGVVAARTLGVAGKGTLSVIMQTPGILVIILDLGIATSTIYFVSRRELRPGSAAANSILIAGAIGLRRVVTPLRPDWAAARAASSFSARVHLSNVAGFLLERQDVLLLGWLSGAAAVGLYSVGVSFAELTWYIPSALCTAIMARGGRGSESSGVDYVTRATRIALIIMIGTVGVSLIAVPLVIPLIYGRAFAPAMYSFFALLPGVMADGIARVLWAYQTTRGRLYWRQALAGTAVNAALVILLAPRLGPVGAALASTVAYTGLAAYMIRRFHVDTGARYADILIPQRVDVEVMFRTAKRMLKRAA